MTSTTQRRARGAGFLAWGPSDVNLCEGNARLRALGMPTLLNPEASLGGGGYARYGRWLIGGYGEGGGSRAHNARYQAIYGYGSGQQMFGFTLINLLGLQLTPVVGLGGGSMSASTVDVQASVVNLRRGSGFGGLAFVGVLVEFHLPLWRGWGPQAGMMLGYRFAALLGKNNSDFDLPSSGREGISGFFSRVMVGLGR
jgi:hypothetical protein